ncbi:MAG: 4-hydroxy-tetrahydrodipicolinate synthase [Microscillaceae bacterium]|nr:4-hydroxy-tetrahydrodipicolinate synthase [Microscillaceae bacterium]MDW8459738.1 4-hydroxy-tetrahydrodipicolinate synthase [Cytophagales bacterium]
MQLSQLEGTGVALITPFKSDLKIDFEALERVLAHTQAVDYWVVMGTTAEAVTLSLEERKEVLAFVKAHNPTQKPLVYGIGGNNTSELLKIIEITDFQGIDAVLSVSPYYNKPSQKGIYEHFIKIAEASPKPIILYNVPGRTSANMTAQTTLALAEHPNIIAIKEASGNLEQCIAIARAKPADFLLLSGDDMLAVPMISIGAKGVISVLANALPNEFSQMIRLALQGQFEQANQILYHFSLVNPYMYEESNPVGVKELMRQMGICQNYVRLPLVPASEALQEKIAAWRTL